MNTLAASERFDDLEGLLRLAVEQIASAPSPAESAERVLARAAKWEVATVRTPAKIKTRLYLAAGMALAVVVLVAVAIAIVGGLPREKSIAGSPQVEKTEPNANPPDAALAAAMASGLAGVPPPPAGTSNNMRLGKQPGADFGASGGLGASGAVPSKRGGASAAKEEQADKADHDRMVGNWFITNDDSKRKGEMWVLSEDRILMYANFSGLTAVWHFHRLDAGKDPKQIDITVTKVNGSPSSPIGTIKGIYVLDGDELRLCLADMGKDRPAAFPEKPGPGEVLILQRDKPGAEQPKAKDNPRPRTSRQRKKNLSRKNQSGRFAARRTLQPRKGVCAL